MELLFQESPFRIGDVTATISVSGSGQTISSNPVVVFVGAALAHERCYLDGPSPENLPRSKSAPRTGFSLARRESCETVNTRKGQVTGRTFKPKLQDDLLTRSVQQLMGDALDNPEPFAPQQARAAGQHAELRAKTCVRQLRQSRLLSQR